MTRLGYGCNELSPPQFQRPPPSQEEDFTHPALHRLKGSGLPPSLGDMSTDLVSSPQTGRVLPLIAA